MVAQTDIVRASQLVEESQSIDRAIAYLAAEGKIIQMVIASADTPTSVMLDVSYINYPAAMVDAIRSAMQQRQEAIKTEVAQLVPGFTP